MNAPPAELLGADQDLMGLLAVDVNDESDPAGVLLQGGVVQTCDEEFVTNKMIYLKWSPSAAGRVQPDPS